MSDVRDFIHTVDVDKSQAEQIARRSASGLEQKHVSLVEVIESLGEYVKSEDVTVRSRAILYLSQVLAALPQDFLTRQQLAVISEFLCDRISDGGALVGLKTLQCLPRFNEELAVLTFRAILSHLQDVQTRPQNQRFQALELLSRLMAKYRQAIRKLGSEALTGIIDFVGGEKDPRNLMIVFSILHVLISEWDISHNAETLFDSVFCYFPITFRPPPDDPFGITAQDLKSRLRECIAASSAFAPYAFPQLIEKLDSGSINVKRDVIQSLCACVASYRTEVISNYSTALWDSLKYEIFNVQEGDLAEQAIAAMQILVTRLYNSQKVPSQEPPRVLSQIVDECLERLEQPQHKQAKSATQILHAIASNAEFSLRFIVKAVLPRLVAKYKNANSIEERKAILEPVQLLLDSTFHIEESSSDGHISGPNSPISFYRDELFTLFSQGAMAMPDEDLSFRALALRCLLKLCTLQDVAHGDEIGLVAQHLEEIVMNEKWDLDSDLSQAAVQGLGQIATLNFDLVSDVTVPKILSRLPTTTTLSGTSYLRALDVLASLASAPGLCDLLIRRIFGCLDAAVRSNMSSQYCDALLSSLYFIFQLPESQAGGQIAQYRERITELLQIVAKFCVYDHSHPLVKESSLDALGRLTSLAIRTADEDFQLKIASQVYTLFTDKQPFPFSRDSLGVSLPQRLTMILSTYLLASLRPSVSLPVARTDTPQLLVGLVESYSIEQSACVRHFLLEHISLLVNKFMDISFLDEPLKIVCNPATSILGADMSERAVHVTFCISKALVLRQYGIEQVLRTLTVLLSHEKFGIAAARGFGTLFSSHKFLSKEWGANIRLLAKQKAFMFCIPLIGEETQSCHGVVKANHLIALCAILKHADFPLVMLQLDQLLPLLLQSLDLDDEEAKSASIDILATVAKETPSLLEVHIKSLITRLLCASANCKVTGLDTRLKALNCLATIPNYLRHVTLLPYLTTVDRGLSLALDDPKRLVRREAVICRRTWSKLDDIEHDD